MGRPLEVRLPLSRDRILRAALDLADEGGIEGLTMRTLGRTLGFEAMSLYKYVANKDDLLDGILDLVLAESDPPSPAGDWDRAIHESAVSVHDALKRHPWACVLLMSPHGVRPARLRYMNSLLSRLRDAGFSAEASYYIYHVLDGHIFGFSLWEISHAYTPAQVSAASARFEAASTADELPHLHEHVQWHGTEGHHHQVVAFEFGLDLILDGLKKYQSAG
jgi:AcrR family transcriptional regulator